MKVLNDFHSIPIYYILGFNLSTSLIYYFLKNVYAPFIIIYNIILFNKKMNAKQSLHYKICALGAPDLKVFPLLV